ncbi:uncharacterized protein C2845_PM05G21880 [Panicum miliaceum]|uniref:PGG domain-containing protein n=1 Tax=Panicum miliaceum TaxID=4540 RepID=A0A3L6SX82_PANMI|nr:uncharacterized protein C2845_PM05G21880 [Panicum miliaceum]
MARSGSQDDSWGYSLRKYLLLLASLVATVTYGAGFNPPGGVWQAADRAKGRIAGDPIIRKINYARYLAFFYGNATDFASSLVVIVLVLILSILHDRGGINLSPVLAILRFVMVLDLLSLMGAYAVGTFRDALTAVYSLLLLAGVVAYLVVHLAPAKGDAGEPPQEEDEDGDSAPEERQARGAPGGFWDHDEDGHRPGDAVLKGGPHDARLKAFFVCNTTAFVASLLILVMLLEKKLCFSQQVRSRELYGLIAVTLLGLVAAYAAGSSRQIDTTVYVTSLVGAVVVCVLVQVVFFVLLFNSNDNGSGGRRGQQQQAQDPDNGNGSDEQQTHGPNNSNDSDEQQQEETQGLQTRSGNDSDQHEVEEQTKALEKARSLVLLLATLAAAITYQAGLNPPGGFWQSNDRDGRYMTGDPILLTESPRRYKNFYYCNSIAFVASLVAIILARMKTLHHHNALEAAMVLRLFGLIGAYAAGSCRASGGHAGASPEKEKKAEELLEKRRKRLLLFAIFAATITYQAGLTPPGGFLVNDDGRAGDPVLLSNYPRRYTAFYCNSVSFMLSIALIILLVNPNLYRPAIRSNALSVCTAAGLIGVMGGYAAGSTQHLKTSIYIFALAALVLSFVVVLVAVFFVKHLRKQEDKHNASSSSNAAAAETPVEAEQTPAPVVEAGQVRRKKKLLHAKRKYLMLLGILAASVTYQAGLAPPGGSWQSNDGEHTAGDSVMHDNRRARYLAFFYSNSTSFVASVVVIVLLLPPSLHEEPWWLGVMNTTIVLDLVGLLVAYAAGSSRTWKTSVRVSALVVAVLGYFAIHVLLSCCSRRGKRTAPAASAADTNEEANGGLQATMAPGLELSEAI